MKKSPKIMVLRLREIIYTAIFLALGILLVVLLIRMFTSPEDSSAASADIYVPGVYTSALQLGSRYVDVEVTVDADRIRGARLVDLDESITTMYPLMEPAMESLEEQLLACQSTDQIVHMESRKYTSQALLTAIEKTLQKAER